MAHFAKDQWQDVVPEYEVLELHVKRMVWVLRYLLSTYLGRDHCPIAVLEWNGEGCLRDADGVVLMHLRRSPWVTLPTGSTLGSCGAIASVRGGVRKCTKRVCEKHMGLISLTPRQHSHSWEQVPPDCSAQAHFGAVTQAHLPHTCKLCNTTSSSPPHPPIHVTFTSQHPLHTFLPLPTLTAPPPLSTHPPSTHFQQRR